jgi:hypothetical protein
MRAWLALAALVIVIRLPFLWTPIQGDDPYYLFGAQHAQIDPLHPHHARYVFQGREVDMRGHPHPPGNAWFLAAILALTGDVRELPFHAAYLLWTVTAAASAWWIAKRFSAVPAHATALFLVTPAFVINGNSLESDLPFVALWLASFALYVRAIDARKPLAPAVAALALSAMVAYQAVAAAPILACYAWQRDRPRRAAFAAALTPVFAFAAWQLAGRLTSGAMPAEVLGGYFTQYGLQSLENKLRNAAMLSIHAGWLLFPALWIAAIFRREPVRDARDHRFLTVWTAGFFAFALAVFFAGSMRYLLPIALPLAILTAERLRSRPSLLVFGIGAQLTLSLALATSNHDHWSGYRAFAASLAPQFEGRRVWVNGEFGLRFYAESAGALPLEQGQAVRPGDLVISSELAYPVPFTTGGGVLAPLASREIRARLPFQLIGLHARSGYSTAHMGWLPFGFTNAPIDVVHAHTVLERKPTLSFLPMNSPEADSHIVAGVYSLEQNAWRWTSGRASFLLKAPDGPTPLRASLNVYEKSPATRLTLQLDGETVFEQALRPGALEIVTPPVQPRKETAVVTLTVDRTFQAPGDQRELGVIVAAIGFR